MTEQRFPSPAKSSPVGRSRSNAFRRVAQWWTLSHWSSAIELALKLAGLVAIVGAYSFFTSKPHVLWFSTCYPAIDVGNVQLAYSSQGKATPPTVLATIEDENQSLRQAVIYPQSKQAEYLLQHHQSTCVPVPTTRELPGEVVEANHHALVGLFYVVGGKQSDLTPTVPQYALGLAQLLPADQLVTAIEAIERSRYWVTTLIIKNYGPGTADQIQVAPPVGYELASTNGLALLPGAVTRLSGRTPTGTSGGAGIPFPASPNPPSVGDFLVLVNRSGTVNLTLVGWLTAALFVLIWLPVVAREVIAGTKS